MREGVKVTGLRANLYSLAAVVISLARSQNTATLAYFSKEAKVSETIAQR